MDNYLIKSMYTLSESMAGEFLGRFKYPWEAVPNIKECISMLIPKLDKDIFEEREEGVWVAKSVKIASTATIIAPTIIDEEAEIRPGAFIRGNAKIGKNHMAFGIEKDVLELDVAMDDTLGVDVIQHRSEILEPAENLLLGQIARRDVRQSPQLAAVRKDEIHHEIDESRLRIGPLLEDMNQTGMLQTGEYTRFGQKALLQRFVGDIGREHLERGVRPPFDMHHLVHTTHATLSERTNDAVVPQSLIWL